MKLSLKFFLCMLAICSLAGLFSPIYWLFDLFNHFRVHAVLASIILFSLICLYDKKNLALASAVLIANSVLFAIPLYQSSGISNISSTQPDQQVKILASNVYTANTQHEKAIAVITQKAPDIIALTETDQSWISHFDGIENVYKHSMKHPRDDNFGMAIYSKLPFQGRILDIGNYHLPLAILDFEKFRLIVAHPIPPVSRRNMDENRLYLEAIAQNTNNGNKPVILAGDLNSTLWGEAVKPLFNAGLKRINPLGVAYTWPTQMPIFSAPIFAMQIDHFFAKGIAEADFGTLSTIGSDHYPILTTVRLH